MEPTQDLLGVPAAEVASASRRLWTQWLLSQRQEPWHSVAARLCVGLALCSLYGFVLGLRAGGIEPFANAVSIALGFLAVAAIAAPALHIILGFFNAPISIENGAAIVSRAMGITGLVLAGLTPLMILFGTTIVDDKVVRGVATAGLLLAGFFGLRQFGHDLKSLLMEADRATRHASLAIFAGFAVFACLLADRVWTVAAPALFGGAR